MREIFLGPLGSHKNYISHIAFPNVQEYLSFKQQNQEQGQTSTPAKYAELRIFLNALNALNNIPDYLFSEHQDKIKADIKSLRRVLMKKFPELERLADLANAAKHCGRYNDGKGWTRAQDLQRAAINVRIGSTIGQSVEYEFLGPLPEHDAILRDAFTFWLSYYHGSRSLDDLIKA